MKKILLSRGSLFVSIVLAATLAVVVFAKPHKAAPYCFRLHAGTVSVDVPYSPEFLYPKQSNLDHGLISLYQLDGKDRETQDTLFVIDVREDFPAYQSVESLWSSPDKPAEPGPKFTQKVSFNGHPAVRAEGDGYVYYKIPFGNRVILVSYFTKDLSPSEREKADVLLKEIAITQAESDRVGPPEVGQCF
jgi:hypothetical protein